MIFGADVDESLVGASGDSHSLQDAVRVTLEHAAVHEGAGVALVGIADDVFFGSSRFGNSRPFESGGESRAAAAAQAARYYGFDDVLGCAFMENFVQGFVTVFGD